MSSDTRRIPVKILHNRLMIVARKVANMRKVHLSISIADKIDSALNATASLGRSIIFVSGVVLLFLISVGIEIAAAEAKQGRQLYMQYCGKDGRGSGSVSPYLKIAVPDLTVLKRNNKGIYPLDDVMATIDGRRTVRSHGDRDMPVWGEIFLKETERGKYSELTSLLKAKVIAEYVATLQR